MSEKRVHMNWSDYSSIFTLEKRFERDYKVIKKIGTGGFAKVYKVKNLLDKTEYAVKKIVINIGNKSQAKITNELDSVLKEIRYLAKMKNDFIVRYNQSWIEVALKEERKQSPIKENIENRINTPTVNEYENENSFIFTNFDKYAQFRFSSSNNSSNLDFKDSLIGLRNTNVNCVNMNNSNESIKINNQIYLLKGLKKLTVFIQMELCKETLGDVLKKRQEKIIKTNCQNLEMADKDMNKFLNFFLQIIKAVGFLHQKEKLIHRDLKPHNIFLTDDLDVRIGDFGLVTEFNNVKYKNFSPICENEVSFSRKSSINSASTAVSLDEWVSISQMNFHTKNVGTLQYASPEQLNNNYYDYKTDIYALGLILFEMLCPMKTSMERYQSIKDLKENGKLPESFTRKFNNLSLLIVDMVNKCPSKRPNAVEIQDIILSEMKKFEVSKKLIFPGNKVEIFEYLINFESNENLEIFFLKIIDDKLLIFQNKNSPKAKLVYDLNECEVNWNIKSQEIQITHSFIHTITLINNNEKKTPGNIDFLNILTNAQRSN